MEEIQHAGFFFDEAHRRIVASEGYISRIFRGIHSDYGGDNTGVDLRAAESITGEYIKDMDIQMKQIADFDIQEEDQLRKMSWFDYNFHILALKKDQDDKRNAMESPEF